MSKAKYPIISRNKSIQRRYISLRRKGQSHNMAEMLAMQKAPGLNGTDTAFNRGRCNGNQFAKKSYIGDAYRKIAEKAGVSTQGKFYMSQLAQCPGDPEAWVSDTSDVRRVLESRGDGCDGVMKLAKCDKPGKSLRPKGGVAEDILDSEVSRILDKNPEVAPTPKEQVELKEQIRRKRKPHWVKD